MKKLYFLLLIGITFSSCKKKDPDRGPFFEATINGVSWRADTIARASYEGYSPEKGLFVTGTSKMPLSGGNYYNVFLWIYPPVSQRKFIMKQIYPEFIFDATATLSKKSKTEDIHGVSDTGFVEITHITDNEVEGTFEFDVIGTTIDYSHHPKKYDTITVRNGKFRVPIRSYGEG